MGAWSGRRRCTRSFPEGDKAPDFPSALVCRRRYRYRPSMAIKIVVFYGHPDDVESWDRYYADVHMPMAARIPGLVAQRAARVTGTLGGETAPYHVLGELVFGDRALLQAGLASPEGQAAARDLTAIAAPGTLTLLAEDLD